MVWLFLNYYTNDDVSYIFSKGVQNAYSFLLQTLKTKRYHQSLNIKNYQIVIIEFVRFIRPTY